jgi:hypothetical protein
LTLYFEDGAGAVGSSLTDGATYGPSLGLISDLTVYNGTWMVTATILTGDGMASCVGESTFDS